MLKIDEEISVRVNSQTNNSLQNDNQKQESSLSEENESTTSVSILQTQSQSLFAGLSTPTARASRDMVNSQIENVNQTHESTFTEENGSTRSVSPIQTQSQSLFSGLSTPTRPFRDILEDRFNGILYHIIPSEGQITIIWRETIFSRLAIRLYQQYTREIDDDINQTLSQTSTPAPEKDLAPPPPAVSPVKSIETTDSVQQMPLISSISSQVEELTKISRFLQEQLTSINSKIDILLNSSPESESKSDKTNIQTVSVTSIHDDSTFVTLNETKEDTKLTPGGDTYSHVLSKNLDKPEVIEKSVNRNEKRQSLKNDKVKQGHSTNRYSNKSTNQQLV